MGFAAVPELIVQDLSALKYSNGGCIGLGLEVVKEYRKEAGVTESNFSTCVHRLVKKGVISKYPLLLYQCLILWNNRHA